LSPDDRQIVFKKGVSEGKVILIDNPLL